jgi:uncharacterized membrane protein
MKNKIKLAGYSVLSVAMTFPAVAFGAFDPNVGGTTGLPKSSLMDIISNIMQWMLTAIGIAGVIGFVIAGLLYLTAAGDEKKITTAKQAMIASVTGVIVAIAGVVALNVAKSMLSGNQNF